jgi:predicted Zn-dependent protease
VRGVRGRGTLRLVPLDDFPTATLQALADYYREKYDLSVELAASLDITAATYDPQRRQLNADALIDRLEAAHPQHPDETLVVIGLVADDIYIPTFKWRYALSYRRDDRYAVVSSARMDYGCLGLVTASSDRVYTRLRKMVSKNVGILYYRLPVSDDPRSVLYGNIGGVQEFDRMTDDF